MLQRVDGSEGRAEFHCFKVKVTDDVVEWISTLAYQMTPRSTDRYSPNWVGDDSYTTAHKRVYSVFGYRNSQQSLILPREPLVNTSHRF